MNKALVAAGVVATLLLASEATAQAPQTASTCETRLTYTDGQIPDPENLHVGSSVRHPDLPGVTLEIAPGMMLGKICKDTIEPVLAVSAAQKARIESLNVKLVSQVEAGRTNARLVTAYQEDPVYRYAYTFLEYMIIAGIICLIILLYRPVAWTIKKIRRNQRITTFRRRWWHGFRKDRIRVP